MGVDSLEPRRILKSFGGFGIAAVVPKVIAFALLPWLSSSLGAESYGQYISIVSVASVISIALSMGFDHSTTYYYFRLSDDTAARRAYIAIFLKYASSISLVSALLIGTFSAFFEIPHTGSSRWLLLISLTGACLSTSLVAIPLAVLRCSERTLSYMIVVLVQSLSSVVSVSILVLILDFGAVGWASGVLFAQLVTSLVAVVIVRQPQLKPFPTAVAFKDGLHYGLPFLPHAVALVALQALDRSLVAFFTSSSAAGIYAISMAMAIPITIVGQTSHQALLPHLGRIGARPHPEAHPTSVPAIVHLSIVGGFSIIWMPMSPFLIGSFFSDEFHLAASIAPLAVIFSFLMSIYYVPMVRLTLVGGKPQKMWIATISSCLTGLVSVSIGSWLWDEVGASCGAIVGGVTLVISMSVACRIRGIQHDMAHRSSIVLLAISLAGMSSIYVLLKVDFSAWATFALISMVCVCSVCLLFYTALKGMNR